MKKVKQRGPLVAGVAWTIPGIMSDTSATKDFRNYNEL